MKTKRRNGFQIMMRLLKLVKPLTGIMILAIIMGSLGFLTAIFIPVLGSFAILGIAGFNVPFPLQFIFIAVLICALFRGILRYAEQAANHHIAFKLLAIIRDSVFKALRRLAPAKLETRDKGNLISMITTDIELIEVFYAHTISPVAIAIIISILMSLLIGSNHYTLGLIALGGYLFVGLVIPFIISRLGQTEGVEYRNQLGDLSTDVLESLRGLQEVIQYDHGDQIRKNIKNKTMSLNKTLKSIKNYEGLTNALTSTAIILFSILILFKGISLYQQELIGFDGLLVSFMIMISSFGPVVALANVSNNLIQTFAAADRVFDLLDEDPVTSDVVEKPSPQFGDIELDNVEFSYDDEIILDHLSLKIPENKVTGIVGASGSGKSTILRLIMRFWEVQKGSLSINETNVNEINTTELRDMQSFVTQDTMLFNKSILDNLRIAKVNATMDEIVNACEKAAIHNFIITLPDSYDTIIGEQGSSLSGGERQRLGLARAFLHDAPLLILDEPTSNLDSLNEGIILKSIDDEKDNKTIVLVSHLAKTMSIADSVVSLETLRKS